MSDSCEELEGDVEEFDGDDLVGAFGSSILNNTQPEKVKKEEISTLTSQTASLVKGSTSKESESKSASLKQKNSAVPVTENLQQPGSSDSDTKKKILSKKASSTISDPKEIGGATANISTVGDIASAITSIDNVKPEQNTPGFKEKMIDSNSRAKEKLGVKRKLSENSATISPKGRKVKLESKPSDAKERGDSGRNLFADVEKDRLNQDKESKRNEKSRNVDETSEPITEEELKAIDTGLAEEMFEDIRKCARPTTNGTVFTLQFSPVEIADLAETSMQDLIRSQTSLSFCFRRQAVKFKKKKGYGEICFTQALAISTFLRTLCYVKLSETHIDVSLTVNLPSGKNYSGSFVLWLNKSSKLLKLMSIGEEVVRAQKPTQSYFELEEVPSSAHPLSLKIIFPCTPFIDLTKCAELPSKPGFKGPVYVCYPNADWLDALSECCTDFTYNGHPLNIIHNSTTADKTLAEVPASPEKEDIDPAFKRQNSAQAGLEADADHSEEQESSPQDRHEESDTQEPLHEEEEDNIADADEDDEDDDISNMTRDVCAGMLESLNKLKQLETDDPNVQKILEMQEQLAKLQKSLSKPKLEKDASTTTSKQDDNPWTLDSSDIEKETEGGEPTTQAQDKRISKKEKRERKDLSQAEQKRQEMENLQKIIDDAAEAEKQQEEESRLMQEMELKAIKEQEEKRRASWAKKMIEDLKKGKMSSPGENSATKKEAQKLLVAREEKLRQQKEAEMEKNKLSQEQSSAAGKEKSEHMDGDLKEGIAQIILPFQEIISAKSSEGKPEKLLDFILNTSSSGNTEGESSMGTGDQTSSSTSKTLQAADPSSLSETQKEPEEPVVEITEEFYKDMKERGASVPKNYKVVLQFYENRGCPVQGCPAKRYFKTEEEFLAHWQIFHQPNMTVRFCAKCSAYFANKEELLEHLKSRHTITRHELENVLQQVRTKVIRNPSFRDPSCFSFAK